MHISLSKSQTIKQIQNWLTSFFFSMEQANTHAESMWIFAVYWEKYPESNISLCIPMYKNISFNDTERLSFSAFRLAWVAFKLLPITFHQSVIANAYLALLTVNFMFFNSLQLKLIAKSSWRSIYWRISNGRGLWFPEEKFRGYTIWKQRNRRQGLWPSGRWRFRRIWFLWI